MIMKFRPNYKIDLVSFSRTIFIFLSRNFVNATIATFEQYKNEPN